jgi:rfaE bifunctional protein kinase chain/domain
MTVEKANREQFAKTKLLVVGDVMLDRYWFGDSDRISPEAPVPVVQVAKVDERLGGAANVARNVAALGANTTILGVVGEDEAGNRISELLRQSGVNSQLEVDPKVPTTVKLRVIARQQQLIRLDFEETPSQTALEQKLARFEKALVSADVLVLSDYGKGALSQVAAMIEYARAQNKVILVDPKGEDYEKYRGATLITPNRSELRQVVGRWADEDDLTQRAQDLRRSLGIQALLLTRSEEGMSMFTDQGVSHVRAQAREVCDVSGAGDTVIATLAVALAAQQRNLLSAARALEADIGQLPAPRAAALREIALDVVSEQAPRSGAEIAPDEAVTLEVTQLRIREALDSLPPDYRLAVTLADLEGLSYKEIAECMDCPIGTVMSRIYRGRKILHELLHDHAVEIGLVREGDTQPGARTSTRKARPAPQSAQCELFGEAVGS